MLESKASQFTLLPEGTISWQEKMNNPTPGVPVATLVKGDHILRPQINIIENEQTSQHDQTALSNSLKIWLNTYFTEVLEPLMLLECPQGQEIKDDPVSVIASKIYDGLGIIPRSELEDVIEKLTTETRVDVRAKKIRLGPILIFIPALNKPAAVKLRALLWSLFHGKDLPATVPADGIVSLKIEDEGADQDYYRSIGYPLYGGRAVRIDMLDRVISCVYDHAEGGKFQARHEMAEWLGSSIEDLYKVLESMGHTKIHDPVEQAEAQQEDDNKEEKKAEEGAENKKPELATFRLKKGKAFATHKSSGSGKGPKQKDEGSKGKAKSARPKKKDHKRKDKKDDSPRVISIEAKVNAEDSPFAILQQLKK